MPLVSAESILNRLQDALAAIPLQPDTDPAGEKLFEVVQRYGNKSLGQALVDLTITKGRVCLIVPEGVHRVHDDFPSHRVLTKRFLLVELLIADRAYYKAAQVAVFGGDKNVGVIAMGERVEEAIEGKDMSEYGPALFDDGAQQTISDGEKKEAAGREVWIQSLIIPAGTIETECF